MTRVGHAFAAFDPTTPGSVSSWQPALLAFCDGHKPGLQKPALHPSNHSFSSSHHTPQTGHLPATTMQPFQRKGLVALQLLALGLFLAHPASAQR